MKLFIYRIKFQYQINSMNPNENMTICPHCKNPILANNLFIHEASCEREMKKRVIIEQIDPPPNKDPLPKKEFKQYKQESVIDEYNCPNCEQRIRIDQIDNHMSICEQRPTECQYCKELFPFSLMEDHQVQCNKNSEAENVNRNVLNNNNQIMEPEHQNDQQPEEEVKEVFGPNGSYQRFEVKRLPGGGFQSIMRSSSGVGGNQQGFSTSSIYRSNSNMGGNMNVNMNMNNNMGGDRRRINNAGGNMMGGDASRMYNPNPNNAGGNMMGGDASRMYNPNPYPNNANNQDDYQSQLNSFSMFNQNNHFRDQFDNFDNFFGLSNRFPRGLALRPMMGNNFNMNDLPFFLSQLQPNANTGLTKEEMDSFESYEFIKRPGLSVDDLKCVICYSDFKDQEKNRCLPCFHKFHVECIDTWLAKNSKCPICKYDLNKEFGRGNEEEELM